MAKQVFESHELSEYIFAFSNQGYDEHQEKLHRLFGEMFQADFGDILPDFYVYYYENWMRHDDETPHIVQCLQETCNDDELQEFAQSMRWCRCRDNPGQRCDCRLYPIFKEYDLA